MNLTKPTLDPAHDLVLERVVAVPRALVWRAWTEPEHLKVWFTPRPWTVADCTLDLRPGGAFTTVMRSPEGELMPNHGCFLEIVERRRLVFTDALLPGFRPAPEPFFTAMVLLEDEGAGTRYTAIAMHATAAGKKKHEEMGFHEGWGKALDQLVEHTKSMQA